jgi:hypothetical protein
MPNHRLPEHIVTQILIRLEHDEPALKISTELGVARSAVYKIRDNLIAWGTPYPPTPSMRPGNPRILSESQVEVRDSLANGVEYA